MRRSRILESAFHEPGFLWRPQGKAGERCEGIPRYVEQARRGLDAAGTQKDGSEDPVTMAERIHLFPSRTQQLSSHASKVLGWKRPGRIDCCRSETKPPYYTCGGFYYARKNLYKKRRLVFCYIFILHFLV